MLAVPHHVNNKFAIRRDGCIHRLAGAGESRDLHSWERHYRLVVVPNILALIESVQGKGKSRGGNDHCSQDDDSNAAVTFDLSNDVFNA